MIPTNFKLHLKPLFLLRKHYSDRFSAISNGIFVLLCSSYIGVPCMLDLDTSALLKYLWFLVHRVWYGFRHRSTWIWPKKHSTQRNSQWVSSSGWTLEVSDFLGDPVYSAGWNDKLVVHSLSVVSWFFTLFK